MIQMIRTWLNSFFTESKSRMFFERCRDSEGNMLTEEDILFMDGTQLEKGEVKDLKVLTEEENGEVFEAKDSKVIPIFDEAGNFPIAIKKDDHLYYLKVSKQTGEVLPMHAGCCEVLSVILIGGPSAGKTVYFLELIDSMFHDMLARDTTCSFSDDLPINSGRRTRYEEAKRSMKSEHILPPPNRRSESVEPYFFYVQCQDEDKARRVLLRLDDIDGEQCTEMEWESKIFHSNIFMIAIGADELLAAERGEDVQYTKVVSRFLPRLKALRQDGEYEVRVMITKCDLLDFDNPYLQEAAENSVEIKNGKLLQTVHGKGFDYEVFSKRSRCVREYLKNECPNFYRNLTNAIPAERLEFCMIASIGEDCKEGKYKNLNPYFIDEPILSILAKEGLYPVAVPGKRPEEVKIKPVIGGTEKFRKAVSKFKNILEIPEEEYDEDYVCKEECKEE